MTYCTRLIQDYRRLAQATVLGAALLLPSAGCSVSVGPVRIGKPEIEKTKPNEDKNAMPRDANARTIEGTVREYHTQRWSVKGSYPVIGTTETIVILTKDGLREVHRTHIESRNLNLAQNARIVATLQNGSESETSDIRFAYDGTRPQDANPHDSPLHDIKSDKPRVMAVVVDDEE